MEQIKRCTECGRILPLSEFNKCRRNPDGLQDKCRECFSRYNKAHYAKNSARIKENVMRYKQENPQNVFQTRLKTCEKNPTMINAQKVVDEAIKAGIITRPHTCSGCGCSDKEHRIEAHHSDYSKPLDVVWLCTPCHRALDAKRRLREGKTPYGVHKEVNHGQC